MIINYLILIIWLAFLVTWIVSARTAKRNVSMQYGAWFWSRIIIVLAIVIMANIPAVQIFLLNHFSFVGDPVVRWIGVVLAACGIGFAIWARVYLGRNWGMPMSVKENPELVKTGPYVFVRHPIYFGVLLAMLGSGLVVGPWYFLFFIALSFYFFYGAKEEEKMLIGHFGQQYVDYKKHTSMIIPFIL